MNSDRTLGTGSEVAGQSFRDVMLTSEEDADFACAMALEAVGAVTGGVPPAVQLLLDSGIGGALARMVIAICDEEGLPLGAAVQEAVERQQHWVVGHDAARVHGVAHDMPYLSAWVALMARAQAIVPSEEHWWLRAPLWRPPEMFGPVDVPEDLRNTLGDFSGFAFSCGLDGAADEAVLEELVLSTAASIVRNCDVTVAGAAAFLADERDGLAFALTVRSQLALEPEKGAPAALNAALAVWMAIPLGRAGAERTGFDAGLPRLQGLVMAHDRQLSLARQLDG